MFSPNAKLNVLEHSKISPPKGSIPPTILPLTFFDIPWLLFYPNQPLFFYDFPHTTTYFSQTILPKFKHSLSLTLHHFFPLAGNLILPQEPSKPYLVYDENDGISFTFQESNGDFNILAAHHARNVHHFHQLVPHFDKLVESATTQEKYPLLCVKITFFPLSGFCIGFALRQVAADGRTFDNFLKTWAEIYKIRQQKNVDFSNLNSFVQFHERDVIHDPNELEQIFLKQWWHLRKMESHVKRINGSLFDDDVVRATFLVGQGDMQKLKEWILVRSVKIFGSTHLLLSPYVVTCAFIWVCWIKASLTNFDDFNETPLYLGFIAGGIHRLGYFVPTKYIGNCVAFGRAMVKKDQLYGKYGILNAAKALGDTITELNREVLDNAKDWINDLNVMFNSDQHVMITGSPKVGSYGLDFGWGRPKKVEEISIDKTNAISLCESRDVKGGIEVGLALPKEKMDAFGSLFYEGLKNL